jgi:hypothetical protein
LLDPSVVAGVVDGVDGVDEPEFMCGQFRCVSPGVAAAVEAA